MQDFPTFVEKIQFKKENEILSVLKTNALLLDEV